MRRLAMLAATASLLAACGGGSDTPAVSIEPATVTATAAAVTASPTPASTVTAAPSTSTPPVSTPTSSGAPPQATSTPAPGDLDGFPFSTVDVRTAVELGRGFSFWLVEDREPLCPGTAVPGRPYWSANLAGSDFGPVFVLWVYPDRDALREDWEAIPGASPRPRVAGCELPTGFVYWHENLVLTFAAWLSLGEELPLGDHNESPGDHPAVGAFLALER